MKYKVCYVGNYYKIPEMILFNHNLKLNSIICEEEKLNEDITTFSLVRNVPAYTVDTKAKLIELLKREEKKVDFFIMCSFGKRVPMECLSSLKIFNIHYSQLPYYKGRHPTYWATVCGEKEIGITLHLITDKIDEGEIIGQEKIPYYLWMNETMLFDKLTEKIPVLLDYCIKYIENKKNTIINVKGYYYPIVSEREYTINLENDSFEVIFNKVRAQSKYKGAKINIKNNIYWLKEIKFIKYKLKQSHCIIDDNTLLIKYNDDICIKAVKFEKEKMVIK